MFGADFQAPPRGTIPPYSLRPVARGDAPPARLALRKTEAAEALGVSDETFDRYIRPTLPVVHVGSVLLYPVVALETWLAERMTTPTEELGRGDQPRSRPEDCGPWLNVAEAAEHLRCKRQRIYDLVHDGTLEPARDGRRLLFHRDVLDAYLGRRPDRAG